MYIGNVIRDPTGSLWVVTAVNDHAGIVQAVSFDAENCSATQRLSNYEREQTCGCGDWPELRGIPQEDCADCHGTGRYTVQVTGWEHSEVLAPTVQEFILRGVKRSFGIMKG